MGETAHSPFGSHTPGGMLGVSSSPCPKEIPMCYPVKCPVCGKTTWDGCGQHIDQVKASVAPNQWCTCADKASAAKK